MRIIYFLFLGCMFGVPMKAQDAVGDDAVDSGESVEQPISFWMEKKLENSQAILRALATSDFDLIDSSARQLQRLNKIEGFIRRRNPDYRTNVLIFERIARELSRQAQQRNIDGVTLAFNQMAVSCVRCHQALREHESGGAETQ